MPDFGMEWQERAAARKESCAKYAPFDIQETRRVALATITTGKPKEAYQRAVQSHMLHAAVHETSTHVLCEQLADGVWNKIAFLLNLVQNEMLKPKEERLEWILWIDRDAIILDPCRPLSSFLPPNTSEFEHINLIVNQDAGDLNAGLFFFKVNEWSARLFTTILAFRYYRPDEDLPSAEQTAMSKLLSEGDKWSKGFVRVPWYWFNAYPAPKNSIVDFKAGIEPDNWQWYQARKGDFVVHFAGDDGREERMLQWLDVVERMDVWKEGSERADITDEVHQYWDSLREGTLAQWQQTGDPKDREAFRIELQKSGEQPGPDADSPEVVWAASQTLNYNRDDEGKSS
jgi:mannan polymerase II complex MNN10 subunit